MSYDLATHDDDFELTNAKSYFGAEDKIISLLQDSLTLIIPVGTVFENKKYSR